jgi:DNA-binding NarL/FixJ family response regulator
LGGELGKDPSRERVKHRVQWRAMRILIADDHEMVRLGLRHLLAERPGWEICAEAKTGREAVTLARQFEPDVVVMDISMPQLNGLDATRMISQLLPETKIVILTMHFSDKLIGEIVKAGACGYIMKSDAARDLAAAIKAVVNGGSYFTSEAANTLVGPHAMPASSAFENRLTPREREVVQLLAEGKSSKEVAVSLGISTKTAETHRANVLRKLDLHSVVELVRYAIQNKIVEV